MTTLAQLMRSHYVSLNCYLNDAVRTRGDFVRDFLAALVDWNYGDEFAGDTPLFRGETVSDSYLSDLFYAEKPKDWPKYVLRAMLNSHKKSFAAWLSEMSPDEWARVKDNMAEIGVKIENADDFYAAVCESVKNELAKRGKSAAEEPAADEQETAQPTEIALSLCVRNGLGLKLTFQSVEAAVRAYCTMSDDPAAHPFLLLSVENSSTQIVLGRSVSGQQNLYLSELLPAEMLRSREFYGAVVTICRAMAVVVHNAGKNAFFMKKLAEAQTNFDSFEPFRDDESTLCFEVCEAFGARKEIFDGFEEAAAAWKKNPFRLSLTLLYENATEALSARKRLAFLGQWHFENIYQDAVLMCDRKIRDLLAEHSSGRRTFFGIE